jgi:PAS domain S-box-containing protein
VPIVNVVHRLARATSGVGVDPTGGLARLGLAPGNGPLFDAVVERAPVGVFLTDVEGACLYANGGLCELTGVPLERQLGYGWREALHPDDLERVAAAWEQATREGEKLSHDQRFVRPDGSIAWVEMTAVPIRAGDGLVAGWSGVCVDVTERRRSESRYQDLVEHARDAIYAADLRGGFVSVNRAAEELTGYSHRELLEMNFFDLIAPEDVDAAQASIARSLAGADEARIALRLVAKDGHRVHVDVTGRLVSRSVSRESLAT